MKHDNNTNIQRLLNNDKQSGKGLLLGNEGISKKHTFFVTMEQLHIIFFKPFSVG